MSPRSSSQSAYTRHASWSSGRARRWASISRMSEAHRAPAALHLDQELLRGVLSQREEIEEPAQRPSLDEGRQPPGAELVVGQIELGEPRSEEHTSELQSHVNLVCRLLLEK